MEQIYAVVSNAAGVALFVVITLWLVNLALIGLRRGAYVTGRYISDWTERRGWRKFEKMIQKI